MRIAAVVLFTIGIVLAPGCKKNHAPDTPAVPSGQSSGWVDSLYSFSSSVADPDGDSVATRFDWGDGDTSAWSPYVASGDTVKMSHAWSAVGGRSVCAQAKDGRGSVSPWSPAGTVHILAWWSRTFGGGDDDEGFSVQQTPDGGYIIAGYTWSFGQPGGLWLIKTDAGGNKVWDRTLGGDYGSEVRRTQDGGYIIAGVYYPSGKPYDAWLVKTDETGNNVWDKSFGGGLDDHGYSALQTSDGGYVMAGTYSLGQGDFDVWLIKTDSVGNQVWDRMFGGHGGDWGRTVQQTSDGGYVVVSTTESYGAGSSDAWLVKTDSVGHRIWDETYGGSGEDDAYSVQQTSDGGYVIVGSTMSAGAGSSDAWLTKTDSMGKKVWERTFGGKLDDGACSVQQTSDGGYVIAGETQSFGAGGYDAWLIRTDGNGDEVWNMTFGGGNDDYGSCVQQTSDGGYIMVATTYSYGAGSADAWLVKVDAEGRVDDGGGK